MEVKKIIVDELQNGYMNKRSVVEIEIYASYVEENNTYVTEYFHKFMDNPLQVDEECIWKLTYCGKSEESYDYGEDIYIGEYTCTDGWHQGLKPDYVFCPNCGRRIHYVEKE